MDCPLTPEKMSQEVTAHAVDVLLKQQQVYQQHIWQLQQLLHRQAEQMEEIQNRQLVLAQPLVAQVQAQLHTISRMASYEQAAGPAQGYTLAQMHDAVSEAGAGRDIGTDKDRQNSQRPRQCRRWRQRWQKHGWEGEGESERATEQDCAHKL